MQLLKPSTKHVRVKVINYELCKKMLLCVLILGLIKPAMTIPDVFKITMIKFHGYCKTNVDSFVASLALNVIVVAAHVESWDRIALHIMDIPEERFHCKGNVAYSANVISSKSHK